MCAELGTADRRRAQTQPQSWLTTADLKGVKAVLVKVHLDRHRASSGQCTAQTTTKPSARSASGSTSRCAPSHKLAELARVHQRLGAATCVLCLLRLAFRLFSVAGSSVLAVSRLLGLVNGHKRSLAAARSSQRRQLGRRERVLVGARASRNVVTKAETCRSWEAE